MKKMKDSDKKNGAEDILSDDALAENMLSNKLQPEQFSNEELNLARGISQAAGSYVVGLSQEQKNLLGSRISQSINNSKRKRTLVWIGSAAAILVLIGLTFVFQLATQSDIRKYATGISVASDAQFTRLLLSGGKEIQIETQESRIEYSKNGEEVIVDARPKVEQNGLQDANSFHTVIVPYGKRTRITLSDNSTIWLNSGSRLVYPATFDPDKREVYLEGEAMFEVDHDAKRPFYVLSRDIEVKVLGTVFNLCAYSDENTTNTVLESGAVELRYNGKSFLGQSKEKMVPGMLAVFNPENKSISQTKVNTKDFTSWKDGYLVLEKNTLESIAKKLSRYYNVSIVFDNQELANETFSGDLDLRNSAIQVLELIAEMMDIEIAQVDDQIKIRKKQN
ncbi:MAG: FecR domain-containing protein [Prolixibacteraceae bacterium]|nr:FecR domain-containing protein [Prolixibacteraceae bacterium]